MEKLQGVRSIIEMMNDVLGTVRDYYDSEYAYYIEKNDEEILNVYEWCAEGIPWQRDRLMMLSPEKLPKWARQENTDTTADSYSIILPIEEDRVAVLAAVGVHRGGCELSLLRTLLPYITEMLAFQKMQKRHEYLSYHDTLTGLLNRNSFVNYLEETKQKKLKSLGALSADINGLKLFNKEFGREYGDEVVVRVGEVLEEYFHGAFVYRLSGDEYLVLAENISYEQFMANVRGAQEKLDNISLGLVTFGYAWEKIDIDVGTVVNGAENMMHDEKAKYYKHLKKGHHEPIIKEDLLADIENGRFVVCLVPVMDAATEDVVGAEAVVRYHHQDLGIMNPERYITMLEETRLSHYLDLHVFEEVCKTLCRWEVQDLPMIPISVNFSGATLRQANVGDKIMGLVEKHHVSCEYLQIEVAEGREMNQEMLAETSNKIRKANVRVLLDHFGAKDSSFSILSIMEFDALKLDSSIINSIISNGRSQIVAKAVIDICRRLGAMVYAAGIETQDQLNMLKELGCDYVQGTLFNKPITIETFEVRYMQ